MYIFGNLLKFTFGGLKFYHELYIFPRQDQLCFPGICDLYTLELTGIFNNGTENDFFSM